MASNSKQQRENTKAQNDEKLVSKKIDEGMQAYLNLY